MDATMIEARRRWAAIEARYQALLEEPLSPPVVADWLRRWSAAEQLVWDERMAGQRAINEQTRDEVAARTYQALVSELVPRVRVAAQELRRRLLSLPGYTPAPEHHELLRQLRAEDELFRAENVPLQAQIDERVQEYIATLGAMTVIIDGQELTLQQAAALLLEPERALREHAWRAGAERRLQDQERITALFLDLRALRLRLARNAGLPDYRTYCWRERKRFDYTPQDCMTLAGAVEAELVPLWRAQLARRQARLGLDSLRPWDLKVDSDGCAPLRPFRSAAELEEGVHQVLSHLDPELGAQFAQLRNGWLSLESRPGKVSGGYSTFFTSTGQPYIFMNASGTSFDVMVLLHEAGHALHALHAHAAQGLFWYVVNIPVEFAEVASMAMELLPQAGLAAGVGGFYTADEARRALHDHLEYILFILLRAMVVDQFQHWLYAEAPETLSAEDVDAAWERLEQRFLPGVDWRGLEHIRGAGWQAVPHLFPLPFYYIEYAIAQLGALHIWRTALTEPAEALRRYRAALALGGSRPLTELFRHAGTRLAFDQATVAAMAALIAQQLEA